MKNYLLKGKTMTKHNLPNAGQLILIIWLVLALFICARLANAQDSVATWMMVDCVEQVGNVYQFHFGYRSNGIEEFVITSQPPHGIPMRLNAPPVFTTAPGVWLDWSMEIDAQYSAYVFYVTFENGSARHTMPFLAHEWPVCVSTTPDNATEALRWAYNTATGQPYTYVPTESGVIPVPPAPKGV